MIATVTLNPSLDEWIKVSRLKVGALNRAHSFIRYPGGKGINVSRVVQELGGRTIAYALAGGDDGNILRHLMNGIAIPHQFVEVAGSTRNNYKIQATSSTTLTEINADGPRASVANLRELKRRLFMQRPRPTYVCLSGSLLPGAPTNIYKDWIRALRRVRVPAVLDTSGEALRRGVEARPWLIKPNRPEAEALLRRRLYRRLDFINAARDLLQLGPEIVILSLGGEGALLASAKPAGVWFAQVPRVRVDSAVGCGDSLVAGFLVGLSRKRSLLGALRFGVATASASAMTPGTELCHRKDVMRLLRYVAIRQVS